jgi:hypothetical protein
MPTYYSPGERTAATVDISPGTATRVQLVNPIRAAAAAAACGRRGNERNGKRQSTARSTKSVLSQAPMRPNTKPPTSVSPPVAALPVRQLSVVVSKEVEQARKEFDASLQRLFPHPVDANGASPSSVRKSKRPTEYQSNYRNVAMLRSPQGLSTRRPIRPADTPAILHDGSGTSESVTFSLSHSLTH